MRMKILAKRRNARRRRKSGRKAFCPKENRAQLVAVLKMAKTTISERQTVRQVHPAQATPPSLMLISIKLRNSEAVSKANEAIEHRKKIAAVFKMAAKVKNAEQQTITSFGLDEST